MNQVMNQEATVTRFYQEATITHSDCGISYTTYVDDCNDLATFHATVLEAIQNILLSGAQIDKVDLDTF